MKVEAFDAEGEKIAALYVSDGDIVQAAYRASGLMHEGILHASGSKTRKKVARVVIGSKPPIQITIQALGVEQPTAHRLPIPEAVGAGTKKGNSY
jgi:hypothetical protein